MGTENLMGKPPTHKDIITGKEVRIKINAKGNTESTDVDGNKSFHPPWIEISKLYLPIKKEGE